MIYYIDYVFLLLHCYKLKNQFINGVNTRIYVVTVFFKITVTTCYTLLQKRQKEVKKMERSEIDELAYKRSELGKRSNPEERLYWIVMIGVYAYARTKYPSDKDKSVDFKNKVINEMDKLLEKAQADPIERAFFEVNIKATQILDKLIQPRAQLVNKSKQELIDLICRYEAALSGMLNEYDESVPEFFKIRVNEEE